MYKNRISWPYLLDKARARVLSNSQQSLKNQAGLNARMTGLERPLVTTWTKLHLVVPRNWGNPSEACSCDGMELSWVLSEVQLGVISRALSGLDLGIHKKSPYTMRNSDVLVLVPQSWHSLEYHLLQTTRIPYWMTLSSDLTKILMRSQLNEFQAI